MWVEPEIRDSVVDTITYLHKRSGLPVYKLLRIIKLSQVKFYRWVRRYGKRNHHNGQIPKQHWLTPDEEKNIRDYAKEHYADSDYYCRLGYRRLCYNMIDENIAAVHPSTVYRILKQEGLLNRWNTSKRSQKGTGFKQPDAPHKHWHLDIKYLNFNGSYMFLISLLDGYSRYIVHHEVRFHMTEHDVNITVQNARDKFPFERPRIITDNGSQFLSKEFKQFIKKAEYTHIRTSVNYPKSNGKIERWHRTISEECLRIKCPLTVDEFRIYIEDYVNYYNTKRLHSAISYLTPEDYLLGRAEEKIKLREAKLEKAEVERAKYWSSVDKAA